MLDLTTPPEQKETQNAGEYPFLIHDKRWHQLLPLWKAVAPWSRQRPSSRQRPHGSSDADLLPTAKNSRTVMAEEIAGLEPFGVFFPQVGTVHSCLGRSREAPLLSV